MLTNFTVIFLTLITLILIIGFFSVFFDKFLIPRTDQWGYTLAHKINNKFWIFIIELLCLIVFIAEMTITIILQIHFDTNSFSFFIYWISSIMIFLFIFFTFTSTIIELKKMHLPHHFIIMKNIKLIVNFLNRQKKKPKAVRFIFFQFNLLLNQWKELSSVFTFFYLSFLFLTMLNWNTTITFLVFLLVPLYGNYFVYFNKFFIANIDKEAVYIRRVFVYILVFLIYFNFAYLDYINMINNSHKAIDFNNFWWAISSGIYLALDRILKEIMSAYTEFEK